MSLQAVITNLANKIKTDVGTLLTRLTAARAAKLDTVPSTAQWTNARAAKLDTVPSTAQWTNARAAKLDNLDAPVSAAGIKSVQRGTIGAPLYVSPGVYRTDITIAAVNMSKAFVLFSPTPGASSTGSPTTRAELLNSTTLRITGSSSGYSAGGAWQVVEFN
jgi:hypothetical protein